MLPESDKITLPGNKEEPQMSKLHSKSLIEVTEQDVRDETDWRDVDSVAELIMSNNPGMPPAEVMYLANQEVIAYLEHMGEGPDDELSSNQEAYAKWVE